MTGPEVGCGAAIVQDGRILLVKRLRAPEAGCWSLPGGKGDFGESWRDAVRREVAEETGLTLGALSLLAVADLIDGESGQHWVAPVALARDFLGVARNAEPDKHAAIGWFALAAPPEPLSEAARTALEALNSAAA